MTVELAPLSYSLGVEVRGLDLRRPVSDEDLAAIRTALLEHDGLLLLRDQHLTRGQHIAFSRCFGQLETHDAVPLDRDQTHPEVLLVDNLPRPGRRSDGSDSTLRRQRAAADGRLRGRPAFRRQLARLHAVRAWKPVRRRD